MKLQELQNFVKNYKKGTYTKAKWKSEKVVNGDTYTKISNGVIRFVDYASVKAPTTATKANTNKITVIDNVCYYNANTNNHLVHLFVSKNPHHKTKAVYYCNGVEISKTDYDSKVKSYNNPIDLMFVKKLNDIISLG